MSIGSKMRSLGESTYFLKATYEPLKEIMGNKDYIFVKDPINGHVIHTDRIDDELLENVDDLLNDEFGSKFRKSHYNHNIEISWREIDKYAACTTVEEMKAINPDYKTDMTSDGEWIWPLDSLVNGNYLLRDLQPVKRIRIYAPNCTSGSRLINDINRANDNETLAAAKVAEVEVYAPKLVPTTLASGSGFRKGKFTLSENVTNIRYFFNAPYLEDFWINDLPKLTQIENGFHGTKLNKASILRLLGQLPVYTSGTHSGTIGIHVDHQHDDEVLEAIANAEAKGWTLTIQWNGTQTAQTTSTFGLRKPSIYAKLSEIEHPDGSKEQIIDWGHYVSNPEDYEEFSSLEEAYEHFGL